VVASGFALPSAQLAGRDRELATLRAALDSATGGRGQVVLVGGDAGVGKTALASQFCREAADRGVTALVGRSYDLSDTPPYGPWIELFGQRPGSDVPAPVPFARFGNGESANEETLGVQIHVYLTAATDDHPIILLLDDLQWADAASLDLLRTVARQVATLAVVLIVTYRTDELTREHPLSRLVPLLERETGATRLDLRPLSRQAVTAIATAEFALADADVERLVTYVFDRAGGNALFTRQLLRALVEEGVLAEDGPTADGRWRLGELDHLMLPESVRLVIEVRLGRLTGEDRAALTLAAVIGERVAFETWAAASAAAEDRLLETVERAAALHLVGAAGDGAEFRFSHALIREVLYESVLPLRRRALHLRVAEALLAGRTQVPDVVAYHLRRAGDPRAATWLKLAGEAAERVYALAGAADRFDQAAALLTSPHDAIERAWLGYRAAVLRRFRDPGNGLISLAQAAALARDAGDAPLSARILVARGHLLCLQGRFQAGLIDVTDGLNALAALPLGTTDDHWPEEARHVANRGTLAGWYAFIGRLAEAREIAEQALGALDPGRTDLFAWGTAAADAYHALAIVAAVQGRVADAREAFAGARAALRAYQHYIMIGVILRDEMALVVLPYLTDDLRERERLATEAEHEMAWSGSAVTGGEVAEYVRYPRLPLLFLEGRWEEARRTAESAGKVAMIGQINNSVLGMIAHARGERELAWNLVHDTFSAGPATEPGDLYMPFATPVQRLAVALALDEGDIAVARAWLGAHDRWLTWLGARLGRAEGERLEALCARAAGDGVGALAQAERAVQLALEPRQPIALLAATRLVGELTLEAGRAGEAVATLLRALALADACAARYERALTLVPLAEALLATGDGDGANAALTAARAICAELGALPTLARADRTAARLAGLVSPQTSPKGWAALTPREREVVALIAAGLSNKEIGQRLSLSPRTIERHAEGLYSKIGARRRADAVAYALKHLTDLAGTPE
jgi:DNA-binding CsgD family transcriptional regulator